MAQIIAIDFGSRQETAIDPSLLRSTRRQLQPGSIASAKEETYDHIAPEHAAEPIKSMEDINRVSEYLIQNKRYRDNMLFIVGINFGLRASDLRSLRFEHLISDTFAFRDQFAILEKKTEKHEKT